MHQRWAAAGKMIRSGVQALISTQGFCKSWDVEATCHSTDKGLPIHLSRCVTFCL
jgi:hypothetical protein